MDVRCPDCDVAMDGVTFRTAEATTPHVRTEEPRDDVLGTLGLPDRREVSTKMCPECGLLRHYADRE